MLQQYDWLCVHFNRDLERKLFTLRGFNIWQLTGSHLQVAAQGRTGDPAVTVGWKKNKTEDVRGRIRLHRLDVFHKMDIFGDVPSKEVFLIADVLVVIRVLHNVGNVHNKAHKGLCLLAKEVQEVAETAVFCDYEHRSWRRNTSMVWVSTRFFQTSYKLEGEERP